MKHIIKYLLAVVLLTGSTYAFAKTDTISGVTKLDTINKQVSGFTGLKIEGPFNVHIKQGNSESLTMYAPAEVVDRIVAEVSGGVLRIHNKHDNWSSGEKSWWSDKSWWHRHHVKIQVYVTVKNIKSLSTSGSSTANFEDGITANSFKLRVRGSGEIKGKIETKTLQTLISGSGSIKLSGNAESSIVKVSGSGDFKALDLITIKSAVHVSGSGKAQINASDEIVSGISGSGAVSYTGAAKVINSHKSGSGNITRI